MPCKRCGKCCEYHCPRVSGLDIDLIKMRKGCVKTVVYNGNTYAVIKLKCKYLTKGGCRIYKNRPTACKQFPEDFFKGLWKIVNPECGLLED